MSTLNIHPIFVHFPIALLTFYSVLECVRFPLVKRQPYWFYVKAILLIGGIVGGFLAGQTGELAEGLYRGTAQEQLVEMHSFFAGLTVYVYIVLAASYLIAWLHRGDIGKHIPAKGQKYWYGLVRLEQKIFSSPVVILLALIGLALVTVTGALGGAIVYGPDVDPFVSVIYHLFFAK